MRLVWYPPSFVLLNFILLHLLGVSGHVKSIHFWRHSVEKSGATINSFKLSAWLQVEEMRSFSPGYVALYILGHAFPFVTAQPAKGQNIQISKTTTKHQYRRFNVTTSSRHG